MRVLTSANFVRSLTLYLAISVMADAMWSSVEESSLSDEEEAMDEVCLCLVVWLVDRLVIAAQTILLTENVSILDCGRTFTIEQKCCTPCKRACKVYNTLADSKRVLRCTTLWTYSKSATR